MDIAWTTLCALLFLLPGFSFFTAITAARGVSRETRPKSIAAELGAIVLASVVVHGVMLSVSGLITDCGCSFMHFDVQRALEALQGAQDGEGAREIAHGISLSIGKLVVYILVSVLLGYLLGWGTRRIFRGRWRQLFRHAWAYTLFPTGKKDTKFPFAYVLTTVEHEGRRLCYKGPLEHFGLNENGQFSYLVLRGPHRFYMRLDADGPVTTDSVQIGKGHAPAISHDQDLLHLSGDSILNVVIVQHRAPPTKGLPSTEAGWAEFVKRVVDGYRPEDAPPAG